MSEIRATTISDLAGTGPATLTGQSAAKAWVYYNASTGTPTINDSENVSSLTDTATGRVIIVFSTAMATVNYSVVGTSQNSSSDFVGMVGRSSTAVTDFDVSTTRANGDLVDANRSSFVAHGDLA